MVCACHSNKSLTLLIHCTLKIYLIFSLKQLIIDGQFTFSAFFVLLSVLQVGLSKDYLKQSQRLMCEPVLE